MEKYVDIICPQCGNTGKKPTREVNRNKKLGRENFCSRTCAGKSNTGRVRATKKCSKCDKCYIPSSRHSMCPSCRAEASKKLCPICSLVLIKKSSKSCQPCSVKDKPKKERNDEFFVHEIYRRVKLRCRTNDKLTFDVDIPYLLVLWNNQKGICPYTGIKLMLPLKEGVNDKIITASLDRKDSSKGYIKGNVHFVSMAINYMKNSMTHEEAVRLINLIKQSK